MELPSLRELELETLVRQRDGQLSELNDEVTRLRQYVANQPTPQATDPITLPPALMSILLPHFTSASKDGASSSSTVIAALTQRARLLQEENDELYEILKHKEIGKLKEEVHGLRRVVEKLEGALCESHQVIGALSTELDKTYEALMSSSKQVNSVSNAKHLSRSPRNSYHPPSHGHSASHGNGTSRQPPTGPRAFKKPRLSESHPSPPPRPNAPLPPSKHQNVNNQSNTAIRGVESRDHPRNTSEKPSKSTRIKMEVDEDRRDRERDTQSPAADRERDRTRERNHEKEKDRNRERGAKDRDRDRTRDRDRDGNRSSTSRRNGGFQGNPGRGGAGGGGTGSGRRTNNDRISGTSNNLVHGVDRTLAERLGL